MRAGKPFEPMADGTHTHENRTRSRGDLDLATLVIAALASVIAALVTSRLWANGTLFSTAITPVIVALVKEYAQRPVRAIGSAAKAPLVAVKEVGPLGTQVRERATVPAEADRRGRVIVADRPDPDEYERLDTVVPPGEEATTDAPYHVYRQRSRGRRWWVVGLVTGLVAFIVAAAIITVPELVGGGSVSGGGRTTLFSTHTTKKASDSSTDKSSDQSTTPSDKKTTTSPDSSNTNKSSSSSKSSSNTVAPSSSSGSTTTTPQTTTPSTTTTPDSTGGATPTTPTTPTPAPQSAAPPPSGGG
jgi:hypothetical protein